jgi:hypothetical protein
MNEITDPEALIIAGVFIVVGCYLLGVFVKWLGRQT